MKIKLDENLPFRLAALLKSLGHDVHTAYEERLVGHRDKEIWSLSEHCRSSGGKVVIWRYVC